MRVITLHHHTVKRFVDQWMTDNNEADCVNALKHLNEVTGIHTQHILWLYTGRVLTVTR